MFILQTVIDRELNFVNKNQEFSDLKKEAIVFILDDFNLHHDFDFINEESDDEFYMELKEELKTFLTESEKDSVNWISKSGKMGLTITENESMNFWYNSDSNFDVFISKI